MESSLILLCLWMASVVTSSYVFHSRYSPPATLEEPENQVDRHEALHELDALVQHHLRSRSKRMAKRRCGNVLIMSVLQVCNGCLASPPEKRSLYSKKTTKRSLSDMCCSKACSDEDLKIFCC